MLFRSGNYDVRLELDQRTALRKDPSRRKSYRFQVQGPAAMDTIGKALGKAPPELKFFNMTTVEIAGKTVRALRHGMAGQPGFEFFGPWDDGEAVRTALIEAGEEFDAAFAQVLRHPSLGSYGDAAATQRGTAQGSYILISAGPDGIYFSTKDGPGTPEEPILDLFDSGNPEDYTDQIGRARV